MNTLPERKAYWYDCHFQPIFEISNLPSTTEQKKKKKLAEVAIGLHSKSDLSGNSASNI